MRRGPRLGSDKTADFERPRLAWDSDTMQTLKRRMAVDFDKMRALSFRLAADTVKVQPLKLTRTVTKLQTLRVRLGSLRI